MTAIKPSAGPCVVQFRADGSCFLRIGDPMKGRYKQCEMPFEKGFGNDAADAQLIEDAFNVYHETGMTPRQLVDQLAELSTELRLIRSKIRGDAMTRKNLLDDCRRAVHQEWGRATPFRMGKMAAKLGLDFPCPYPRSNSRGAKLFREGIEFGEKKKNDKEQP